MADQAQQVDATIEEAGGAAAAAVGAAATGEPWTHMVKPSGKAPSIPNGGVPVVPRPPRINAKGGTSEGITGGADLAADSKLSWGWCGLGRICLVNYSKQPGKGWKGGTGTRGRRQGQCAPTRLLATVPNRRTPERRGTV